MKGPVTAHVLLVMIEACRGLEDVGKLLALNSVASFFVTFASCLPRVCVCMSIILKSARRPDESPVYYIG